jgi:Hemerythrin HHE cation binding domain
VIRHAPLPFALDALEWQARDHAILERLFGDYEQLRQRCTAPLERASPARILILHLSLHLQIEEELFYPAARAALGADAALEHVALDHRGTLELMARLDGMVPGDPNFDATVAVLEAYAVAHMREEEQAIFPRLRSAGLDTVVLGLRIAQRLEALAQAGPAHDARAPSEGREDVPMSTRSALRWRQESPSC